jgi:cell division protein FtsL
VAIGFIVLLSPGDYVLWTQARSGEQLSPPGPQTRLTVEKTALEFGTNRLSYEVVYFTTIFILLLSICGLIIFIFYHIYHGRKKHRELTEEIRKAEESIRMGFAVLQNDIESELNVLHKNKSSEVMSDEEKAKEARLLKDFDDVSSRVGRELAYIRKIEEEEQNY